MKMIKNRVLSSALAICMLMTLLPAFPAVSAKDLESEATEAQTIEPFSLEPMEISGDGIRVVVDRSLSMTVFDGNGRQITEKPTKQENNSSNMFDAWDSKLPWSTATGTTAADFQAGSARLLSAESGYVTTGTSATDEVATDDFTYLSSTLESGVEVYTGGTGDRLTVTGLSRALDLTRILVIETDYAIPGAVLVTSNYRYIGDNVGLKVYKFVENSYKISDTMPQVIPGKVEAGLWTLQGAALVWGADDLIPVFANLGTNKATAPNAEKANQTDLTSRNNWFWAENGGTPFNDIYGQSGGIGIGSAMPYQVRGMELPTRGSGVTGDTTTAYQWIGWPGRTLPKGETVAVGTSVVIAHSGDYYDACSTYSDVMDTLSYTPDYQGAPTASIALPTTADTPNWAYEPMWETWGSGEDYSPEMFLRQDFLNEMKSLGIGSITFDAGWYKRDANNGEGIYLPDPEKYAPAAAILEMPCTTTDEAVAVVRAIIDHLHEQGFKVLAWCMPSLVYVDGKYDKNTGALTTPAGAIWNVHRDWLSTRNAVDMSDWENTDAQPKVWVESGYYNNSKRYDLCLANPEVLGNFTDYFCNLIFGSKAGEYNFDGLKIDSIWGTHLCYATGHGHDGDPEASIKGWSAFYEQLLVTGSKVKGETVVIKDCNCGTPMNYFDFNGQNRPTPGDYIGSRQMRYRIKMYKGFYGPDFPVDSDHLFLTTLNNRNEGERKGAIDYLSVFGVGASYITKYRTLKYGPTATSDDDNVTPMTYPGDEGYDTAVFKWEDFSDWFGVYNNTQLASAEMLNLYTYGFDYPEAYAFKKDDSTNFYSFFATDNSLSSAFNGTNQKTMIDPWGSNYVSANTYSGSVQLRGLRPGQRYLIAAYAGGVDNSITPINFSEKLMADKRGNINIANIAFVTGVVFKATAIDSETVELTGDGIRVVVDDNMSMTVFRVEEDGSYTQMTQKPEPVAATALSADIQGAWDGELPWSVGTGTDTSNFNNGSAKLLSGQSGYVTTGTRSTGNVTGNEVAHDFTVTDTKSEKNVATYFGTGDRLTVTGKNRELNLSRILIIETSKRNPGVVSVTSKYRNDSETGLEIARFVENNFKIYDPLPESRYLPEKREAGLWTQQGAALVWGMDYVMPVYSTMGLGKTTEMDATRCLDPDDEEQGCDLTSRNNWFWGEQGGLPFNDFWGEKVGILVGSAMPNMIRSMELPTRGSGITGDNNTAYTWVGWPGQTLEPGTLTDVGTSIVGVHTGDNYQGSRQFEQAMSYIPNLAINGKELPADWLASPNPENYSDGAWGNTWESWGGGESFDPIEAINFVNNGTFAKFGIKYVILDACWYPRGTSGGVDLATAQSHGEGSYVAIPSKWASVATYFNMPNLTDEDTQAVVAKWNDFMHAHGFKTAAWCMPMSVYIQPGSDTGWQVTAGSGATIDGRKISIDTPFTLAHPDYLITANTVEYDPITGQLLPGQEKPQYVRQTGFYPQNGTAELCLGNPRVMEEYTDYFCNLMFKDYGFDGLKIDTQWGTQQCFALGHGHDGNPNASIENYAMFWKTIYDKAKAILGEDPWMKHCQCGTMMNFFTQNGTNRPITGDPGSSNVRKARYSIRMWKGLYGDNAPAVSDHVENFGRRAKSLMAAGYVLETKFWPVGPNPAKPNKNAASLTDEQCLKYFPLAVEEGLSKGYYMDEYKFGFDYPEALAYDRPDKATKYYSFFATSSPVSAFTGGEAYTGGGEKAMAYSGPVELRGLEPGKTYLVTDYADNTINEVLKADSKGVITTNVNFTECILLKAEVKQDSPNLGGSSSSYTTITTTNNPDGSITVTVTNKLTGTVTKTTTAKDGTKAVTEIKKDGIKTVEVTLPTVPSGTIKLPVDPVKIGESITVKTTTPTGIVIPIESPKPGVVAVLVKSDGTEEIIRKSVTGENSISLRLEGSIEVKLVDYGKSFTDVAIDNWAYDAIQFSASRELFQATGQSQFTPTGNMTRGMLVTVLARLDGQDTSSGETWYSAGMVWAKGNGISDGTAPESSITREQLAVMLYRYAGKPDIGERIKIFSDEGNVSSWATEAMTWAVNTGILNGKPGGILDPTGTATRAEVSIILQRFVSLALA